MIAALRNLRVYTFGGGAFIVGNESVQKRVGDIRPLLQVSLSTKESWPRAGKWRGGKLPIWDTLIKVRLWECSVLTPWY